jgi:tryptophan 2,3-dioxygenase
MPSDLNYHDYLQLDKILSAQLPESEKLKLPAHDEMLFIIIHQAYELWFKLILHEIEEAMGHMQKTEPLKALHFVRRCVEVMKILVPQIHVLETMKPIDFLRFRDKLKPASGFQSLQFREIEFASGLKEARYLAMFKSDPDASARRHDPNPRMLFRMCPTRKFHHTIKARIHVRYLRVAAYSSATLSAKACGFTTGKRTATTHCSMVATTRRSGAASRSSAQARWWSPWVRPSCWS